MTESTAADARLQAFFLLAAPGKRLCLFHPAQGGPRGRVLYVHPLAEEMNKSRRMVALQSRALAAAGFSVLQIDLHGCGDSSGDFGDALWGQWIDDVRAAERWLADRAQGPLWLWGLRAGCLLAVQAAQQMGDDCNFLFWQPPIAGKPLAQQFLRLKAASEMIGGGAKGVVDELRQRLARGETIDVAGYALQPELVHGLEQATLAPPESGAGGRRVEWIELSSRADAELSPASTGAIERWRKAGFDVTSRIATGPAFWQTTEIEEAPALLEATLAAMTRAPNATSVDAAAGVDP